MLRGLPASGKSTYARQRQAKRINRDELRFMLDEGRYSVRNEIWIRRAEEWLARGLLAEFDVVIDDTNLKPEDLQRWKQVAAECDADFLLVDCMFGTTLEECIARDSQRARPIGEERIRQMWETYQNTRGREQAEARAQWES